MSKFITHSLKLELRRGAMVMAALSQLKEARYGFALIEQLAKQGLDIERGTLYPLIYRLLLHYS